jgi:hypothetical protein
MNKHMLKAFLYIIRLLEEIKDKNIENIEWYWNRLDTPFKIHTYVTKELVIKIRYIEEIK